jgi:transketolase
MKTTLDHTVPSGTTRDGFGLGLVEAAKANSQVVGLCADLGESMRMDAFKSKFPDRYIEVGVAEQNLAGVAAGLALGGKIPFMSSYAVFSPGNSWGVIRSSICYSNLNVKIVGGHAGLTTGPDGATHQALEDLALMQVLPNMTVVVPADQEEARSATLALARHRGPAYLRVGKFETPHTTAGSDFQIGKAKTIRTGSDICLIACGTMVAQALWAAKELSSHQIEAEVINMHTIKPIDTAAILSAASLYKHIVTIEEHQKFGGLGSSVAQVLAQAPTSCQLHIMGVNDSFGQSGQPQELLEHYGLGVENVVGLVRQLLA